MQASDDKIDTFFATPMGRRAILMLGAHGAKSLCTILGVGAALSLFGGLTGCYRAPGTARDQLIFFSEEKELQFGVSAFREVLRSAPLSDNAEVNELVHRVGRHIAEAANKPEYQWEFAVIQDDKMVNAFALPGGKVAVFTGILKHTKDDAGLRQSCIVFSMFKNSGKDGNLPTWKCEGIDHLVVLDDREFPLILGLVCGFRDVSSHAMHQLVDFRIVAQSSRPQHFAECAYPKLQFLLFGEKDQLVASRSWRTVAAGQEIGRASC